MSALTPATKRFAPSRGQDVGADAIEPGDWAYASGYWWKVKAMWLFDGVLSEVELERPDLPTGQVSVSNVVRWRKA